MHNLHNRQIRTDEYVFAHPKKRPSGVQLIFFNIIIFKKIMQIFHLRLRLRCYHIASKTQVAEMIFKFSLIHASVI